MFSSEPHPWFVPLYRRVLVMAFCVAWLIFELIGERSFWLILVGAINGYAVWEFFIGPNYRGVGKAEPPDRST